jgi:hypothetical protein
MHFKTDVSKVNFAMTFLTESALQWFDVAIKLEENDGVHEAWSTSWVEFIKELRNTFGISNLQVKAAEVLDALCMKPSDQISTYNVEFMCHAAHVQWGDEALCYRYYKGLPNRLQDLLSTCEAGKPWTYFNMKAIASQYDQ